MSGHKVKPRAPAVTEIVTSERKYVHYLHLLDECFRQPLRKRLSHEDNMTLFMNLDQLLPLHEGILENVEREFLTDSKCVGQVLEMFAPFFKVYEEYTKDYSVAAARVAELRKNKKAFRKIEARAMKRTQGLDMLSLLVMPVQRVPRYKMLLQALLSRTQFDHPDYFATERALTKVKRAARSINLAIEIQENSNEVQWAQRILGVELESPNRHMVRTGTLHLIADLSSKASTPCTCFLFTDVLIIAEGIVDDDHPVEDLRTVHALRLKVAYVTRIPERLLDHGFRVVSTGENHVLQGSASNATKWWVEDIVRCIMIDIGLSLTVYKHQALMARRFPSKKSRLLHPWHQISTGKDQEEACFWNCDTGEMSRLHPDTFRPWSTMDTGATKRRTSSTSFRKLPGVVVPVLSKGSKRGSEGPKGPIGPTGPTGPTPREEGGSVETKESHHPHLLKSPKSLEEPELPITSSRARASTSDTPDTPDTPETSETKTRETIGSETKAAKEGPPTGAVMGSFTDSESSDDDDVDGELGVEADGAATTTATAADADFETYVSGDSEFDTDSDTERKTTDVLARWIGALGAVQHTPGVADESVPTLFRPEMGPRSALPSLLVRNSSGLVSLADLVDKNYSTSTPLLRKRGDRGMRMDRVSKILNSPLSAGAVESPKGSGSSISESGAGVATARSSSSRTRLGGVRASDSDPRGTSSGTMVSTPRDGGKEGAAFTFEVETTTGESSTHARDRDRETEPGAGEGGKSSMGDDVAAGREADADPGPAIDWALGVWERCEDDDGCEYFYNASLGRSEWTVPKHARIVGQSGEDDGHNSDDEDLAEGWHIGGYDDGCPWYVNDATNQSTWVKPVRAKRERKVRAFSVYKMMDKTEAAAHGASLLHKALHH